jgi:hypothetical protein
MNWLRDVALAVSRSNTFGDWLQAHDLLEILDADGTVEIPSLGSGEDIDDERINKKVLQQIGKKLKRCFGDADSIVIDRIAVNREQYCDELSRPRQRYQFVQVVDAESSESQTVRGINGNTDSLDSPLISPDGSLDDSRVSPDSLDGDLQRQLNGNASSNASSLPSFKSSKGLSGGSGDYQGSDQGKCQHDYTKVEADRSRQGWIRRSCKLCGRFYGYEKIEAEPAAA